MPRFRPRTGSALPPRWAGRCRRRIRAGAELFGQRRKRTDLVVAHVDRRLDDDDPSCDGRSTARPPTQPIPHGEHDGAGDRSEERGVNRLDRHERPVPAAGLDQSGQRCSDRSAPCWFASGSHGANVSRICGTEADRGPHERHAEMAAPPQKARHRARGSGRLIRAGSSDIGVSATIRSSHCSPIGQRADRSQVAGPTGPSVHIAG